MAVFREYLQEYTTRLTRQILTQIIPAPERGMMHTPYCGKEGWGIFGGVHGLWVHHYTVPEGS